MPLAVWEDGVIREPADDGRVACVARKDVADVAAELSRLTGRPVLATNDDGL